ncbi:MAG: aa3-type cytochrome oxidase subunit IV [Acidimicrobiales bacterium]
MKVEWRTILGGSAFLGASALIYAGLINHPTEAAGVAMFGFGCAAYLLLFSYLLLQYVRRDRIPRPEDRFDATQADGEGVVAYFPSASIWPAAVGIGLILTAVGAIFGTWYLVIGIPIFIGAVIGWVVESDSATEVPEDEDEEQAAVTAGHPGHIEAHPEHLD